GQPITLEGVGNGPIDAFVHALGLGVRIHHYEERALSQGSGADAIAIVEITADWLQGTVHGVGVNSSIVTASLLAVLGAVNRGLMTLDPEARQQILPN
ncbi:MAG TPA: alpha-isopropylmalate synthase regulatory domain-containing protein, partial [Trichocoleus sp.]